MTRQHATNLCIILLICAVALGLRLPGLAQRPMHADEAVQAVRFSDMMAGKYEYDPTEFHGPALYIFAWPIAWIQGKTTLAALTETDLRIVPVLLGVATILLLLLLHDAMGTPAIIMAALFIAISPAFTYYNRYFIHESLLVFLTVATIATMWRYRQRPGFGWSITAGASFGLLYATKTTWIIAAACAIIAWGVALLWQKRHPPLSHPHAKPDIHRPKSVWHAVAGAAVALAIIIMLFTSFFTWPRGLLDSVVAFRSYIGRGLGMSPDAASHIHPWYYHLQNLLYIHQPYRPIWTQGFIALLALAGATAAFRREVHGIRMGVLRFLMLFTFFIWFAYSLIPYKTPWLMMTPLLALILLAGVGALVLWQYFSRWHLRIVLAVFIAAGLANLEWQSYLANFRFAADPVNPYVYVHTSPDILALLERVQSIADVAPEHNKMLIRVIMPEGRWPLPWYLRRYPNVGYWDGIPTGADTLDAYNTAIIITAPEMAPLIEKTPHIAYKQEYYGMRPQVLLAVYIRQDLWDKFVASRSAIHPNTSSGHVN